METKTETTALATDKGTGPGKRLERRWYLIALLLIVHLYNAVSHMSAYFSIVTDHQGVWFFNVAIILAALALFLVPLLFKKLGLFSKPRRFKLAFTLTSAGSIVLLLLYSILFDGPESFAEKDVLPAIILQSLLMMAAAIAAGCALYRAVEVISGKSVVLLSGLSIISLAALNILIMILLQMADETGPYHNLYVDIIFGVVYALPLLLSVFLMYASQDDFTYTAPPNTLYFSEELFPKFMVLTVLILVMGTLFSTAYYADGHLTNYFGFCFLIIDTFLPLIMAVVIMILLKKNHWMLAMAGCTLAICFQQGLILFFDDTVQLAAAYTLAKALSGYGVTIFRLFIPLVFCVQRRKSATAVTASLSLWLVLGAMDFFFTPEGYAPHANISLIATPAATFILSLATIAWLFYLYGENNRVYVAGLIAEFKHQEVAKVNETVSKTDQLEDLALTPREKEVCTLLLKSLTVRQIAAELGLAFATVNGYYRSLYKKLGISSKAELFMRFGAGPLEEPLPVSAGSESA